MIFGGHIVYMLEGSAVVGALSFEFNFTSIFE
jgi:hypothetical protein